MTGLELFPRGKAPPSSTPDAARKGKARGPEEGNGTGSAGKGQGDAKRKRKSAESPGDASVGQKDWLFGAPQSSQSAPGGKKAREGDAAGASTGRAKAKSGSAVSDVGSSLLVEHSGRAPRLARVSFKKLTKGTLALGVIFKINEHDMIVSLPSSLTGVVRRKEVSDYFYLKAAASGGHKQANRGGGGAGGRGRYFEDASADDKPLKELFREGQVVRCAITNLAKEVGGRHIELSLRASVLNKGLSLSHLTKGCGVYGSVVSSEDHGYVVTLGLEGVTAFLPLADAPKGGLEVGQPVEAVIQTVKAAARTVTLSADPSLVASAVASGTKFDLRSLKPGMLVDTIVDTVVSNGMLVSFLGYFAGCVDHNNMPVVSGDSKEEDGGWRSLFRPGPEPVRARVLMIDYVNKAIRLTLRPHLLSMTAPSGLPPTGALLEGEVVRVDPTLGLLLRVPSKEGDGGAGATGNAHADKKEKGQARKERRAAAAAAAAAAEASGNAEEGAVAEGGSVGAYVHISRISDERVEHVDKSYKAGQKVRCRVTGSSLVEGWAAASLRPSVLSAAVLRYQDLGVGDAVEGEVAAVEAFGLLVKLGEGVRALVPKNHLGDVAVKNPKARFKVGGRVKGRVLTVDAGSNKATLTLKKSMVKDKRKPITSYQEAKEGMSCTGFVTKVAPFGLHVSFYGNVFGLLPAKALTRHGIHDPSEAFSSGQVVGCVVRSCDTTAYPPKLSLALDVAGKTEQMGDATGDEDGADKNQDDAATACPFSPGDIVSGTVASSLSTDGLISVDLLFSPPSASKKKKKDKKSSSSTTVRGVLPISHLGDHASVCDETLAAKLTPGTSISKLLVLEVDKMGMPIVSLKPLLLSAAAAASADGENKEAFLPREVSDLAPGDLVAGFVSRVESFGVFVKFLGRFSALCPRSMTADRMVEDPRGMFTEGDSVRCVVQRVDEDTGRVVVTLNRTTVSASPGLYLRSFLSEAFASSSNADPSEEGEGEGDASPWGRLEFGATYNAVVVALKEYGVVLKAAASKKEKGGQLMVCPLEQAMDGVEEGDEVKVRVLGMDREKGVLDVTMDTDLVKAGRSKRRRAMVPFEAGESVSAKVVLAKPDAKWAVASTEDGRLLVVQVADFHCPHRTCEDAGLTAAAQDAGEAENPADAKQAKEFQACVGEAFSPGSEGYWASLEEAGNGNPYAGAELVTVVEEASAGKKKTKRRKERGEDLELGEPASDAAPGASEKFCMKDGRVPLGKIVKGAKVLCEVMAVHWDRLDVKVAVKYPKSYGPRNGREEREERLKAKKAEKVRQEAEASSAAKGNKKRRRDQTTPTPPADDETEASTDVKKIVRIRAKVHCAAAGMPGLDAPAKTEGKDDGGDDPGLLPDWHPLRKYEVGQVIKARVLRSEDVVQKKDSNLLFRLLELGVAPTLDGDDEAGEDEAELPAVAWWGQRPPKMGEVHRGVVTEVAKHGVLVSLSASVRGLVPLANISSDKKVTKNFAALFKRGMGVRAVVRSVEEEKKRLILSLAGVPTSKVLPDASLPAMLPGFVAKAEEATVAGGSSTTSPNPGELVEGTIDLGVKGWAPPCLMVRLDGGVGMGRVCVTEVAEEDSWGKDPLRRFVDGQRVNCRVVHQSSGSKSKLTVRSIGDGDEGSDNRDSFEPVELSLRESRLDPAKDGEEAARREDAPEVGSTAKCYVVNTGKSGCFVRLAGGVSGRVLLKLLSDRFVANPAQEFPCGRLVAGKVLTKDEATGHVSLTLQPSVVLDGKGGEGGGLSWSSESLKAGLKVKGRVAVVKDFGVFIQVDDSEVRGMCHRSQAADRSIKDLTKVYDEGDLVKAIVLKVERGKKRLSLGLKPSYFEGDADSSDEEDAGSSSEDEGESSDDEEEDGARKGGGGKAVKVVSAMDMSDESDDGEEVEDDDDDDSEEEEEEDSEEEEEEDSEEEEEDSRSSKRPRSVLEGGLGGGGGSKGANAFSLDFGNLGSMGGAAASSDEDEDSDDESDNGGGAAEGSKSHRSRKKAKERREEEDRISARERTLQDEDGVPETAGDFERLMVAEPNNSLLWVKYMAFKLSLADVEGARSVAERALKAVSFRLEQERFNVWVSLINLEHKYGSRATMKAVMERACQNANPKKVYLHVVEMHEKAQEMEECEEVFQAAAKKFRHSKKVWVAYQLLRLRRGDDAGARQLLQRSLQSLSRHKHVDVISRFAQNEFEQGSVERGRSVFEGLMASYPKRLDLWNVYLDKEIKAGDLRAARNLLERLTGMDFNAKRMKGVFKKYLQFEMDHGDEKGVEAVKAKATEYVASLAG